MNISFSFYFKYIISFSEYRRRKTLKLGEVQSRPAPYRADPANRSIPEEDEDDKENKNGRIEIFIFNCLLTIFL